MCIICIRDPSSKYSFVTIVQCSYKTEIFEYHGASILGIWLSLVNISIMIIVLSGLNMIVRLWRWRWSTSGHLFSPSSLTLCLSSCPALSWQYKQRFKFIEFTINYPCLAQIIFYMCRFVYSGMFTFTFAFGKSTEFLVGNLKWLPIILTHLARSSTDFSALF